ncbi:MAG: FliO/MopB family protein [Burkholderiales bacterium]
MVAFNVYAGDASAAKTAEPDTTPAIYSATLFPTMVSLGLVIGTIFAVGFILRRVRPSLRQAGTLLKPVMQIAVGPREKVAVIQFQDELLVIGITASQISLLTKGVVETTTPVQSSTITEKALLDQWLGRLKPNDSADRQVGVKK